METLKPIPMADGQGWASDRDVAAFFSVSRNTVWRWSREGRLPRPERLAPAVTRWRWSTIRVLTNRENRETSGGSDRS